MFGLEQPEAAHAGDAVVADDQVIFEHDTQAGCVLAETACAGNVCLARSRTTGRVVMRYDHAPGIASERLGKQAS